MMSDMVNCEKHAIRLVTQNAHFHDSVFTVKKPVDHLDQWCLWMVFVSISKKKSANDTSWCFTA